MPSLLTICVMLSIVVSLIAIIDIYRSDANDVRTLRKPLWYLAALVPVLGTVAWFWQGRPQRGPSGKRVAKDSYRKGKRHKISADRQIVVDRLTSDIRTRPPRTSGPSAGSPGSPGSLSDRAARSATSADDRSATSPASALPGAE